MPPASTEAIEPPPAPRVWMSSAGSATRAMPTVFSPVSVGSPPWSSAMSVLVPPMSNVTRSPRPVSRATWRPAAMPPAGPDSTAPAASRAASRMGATPPCDCMIRTSPA
jgi:hypothetical protein